MPNVVKALIHTIQSIPYRLLIQASKSRWYQRLIMIICLFVLYIASFTVLHYCLASKPEMTWCDSLVDSLTWSLKHLYDPGFIEKDFESHDGWSIALGIIAIPIGLIVFVVTGLSVVQTVVSDTLKHLTRGSIPPYIRCHIMIIGNADQILHYYEDQNDLDKLRSTNREAPIVFVITKSKVSSGLADKEWRTEDDTYKQFEELDPPDHSYLFEIDEMDLKLKRSELQAEYAAHIMILESQSLQEGSMLRFINRIINEREHEQRDRKKWHRIIDWKQPLDDLTLTIEIRSTRAEKILQTFITSEKLKKFKMNLQFVEISNIRARAILMESILSGDYDQVFTEDAKRPTILIDGWSDLSVALVKQVRAFAHYHISQRDADHQSTQLVFICDELQHDELKHRIESIWGDVPEEPEDAYYHELQVNDYEILTAKDLNKEWYSTVQLICPLVICGDDDSDVIARAIEWNEHELCKELVKYESQDDSIVLKEKDEKETQECVSLPGIKIIAEQSDISPYRSQAQALPFQLCQSRSDLHRNVEEVDKWAKRIHEDYKNKNPGTDEWADLKQDVKDTNRSSADHFTIKMYALAQYWGVKIKIDEDGDVRESSSEFESKLRDLLIELTRFIASEASEASEEPWLERLVIWEHRRWATEKYLHGVRRADKDTLVPYSGLQNKKKTAQNIKQQIEDRFPALTS